MSGKPKNIKLSERLSELPDFLKVVIALAAGALVYGAVSLFSESQPEPEPFDVDAAISDAYATTTIDLTYVRYSGDYADVCFTNPQARDDILSCYLERPTFRFQIEGVDLSCVAKKPRFTMTDYENVVYVKCYSEEAESHGLPTSYELTSFSEILRKNYGLIGIDSDADENGNFLQPVIFGIEPLDNSIPVE